MIKVRVKFSEIEHNPLCYRYKFSALNEMIHNSCIAFDYIDESNWTAACQKCQGNYHLITSCSW